GAADAAQFGGIVHLSQTNRDCHRTSPACCAAESYRPTSVLAMKRGMSPLVIAPFSLHDPRKKEATANGESEDRRPQFLFRTRGRRRSAAVHFGIRRGSAHQAQ